ncbi:MAG: hypothetical protein IT330_16145, partial [Anaerolineae bacterium]|nr:hypothetical protein [Anaerolineae bacterium]
WRNHEVDPLLFDRESDPHEMKNLAGNKEYSEVEAMLEARLQRWIAETGDAFAVGPYDAKGMLLIGQEFADERWKNNATTP